MTDLVYRLRKRAEIRRQIPTRKSVQEGQPDRIADLLEEAADALDKQWVGLTDEERDYIWEKNRTKLGGWDHGGDEVMYDGHFGDAVIAIEAKLKEKNT